MQGANSSSRAIWGILLKDTSTHMGFEPATFWLLDDPLYLLSYSRYIKSLIKRHGGRVLLHRQRLDGSRRSCLYSDELFPVMSLSGCCIMGKKKSASLRTVKNQMIKINTAEPAISPTWGLHYPRCNSHGATSSEAIHQTTFILLLTNTILNTCQRCNIGGVTF